MTRTKKGSKAPAYEFWGKRPGSLTSGPKAKKITHKIERAKGKQRLIQEPKEPEHDPQEYVPIDFDSEHEF